MSEDVSARPYDKTVPASQQLESIYHEVRTFTLAPRYGNRQVVMDSIPFVTSRLSTTNFREAAIVLAAMAEIQESDISTEALRSIDSHAEDVTNHLTPQNEDSLAALDTIARLIQYGTPEQQKKGKEIFRATLPSFAANLDSCHYLGGTLDFLLEYGSPKEVAIAKEKIQALLHNLRHLKRSRKDGDSINDLSVSLSPIGHVLHSKKPGTYVESILSMNEYLDRYNVPGHQLINAWHEACEPYEYGQYATQNIAMMNDLEHTQKGTVSKLFKNNNIANFARYPRALLLDQLPRPHDTRKEALLVVARDDQSEHEAGAFYDIHAYEIYEKLHDTLGKNYRIRLVEVGPDKAEFKRFVGGDHPEERTVDFAIIEIHGSKRAFGLGKNERSHVRLTARDFREDPHYLGLNKIKRGGILLLGSCETGYLAELPGEEPGLGQQLAEIADLTVIGPHEPAGIRDITIQVDTSGNITNFVPEFVGGRHSDKDRIQAHRYNIDGPVS